MRGDDLTAEDVTRILDACTDRPTLAALRLMAEAGLKVGQVVTLRSCHFLCDERGHWLVDIGRGLRRCGDDLVLEVLDLERHADLPLIAYDASNLFRHLRKAAKRAGIEKRVTSHSLRRYWQRAQVLG